MKIEVRNEDLNKFLVIRKNRQKIANPKNNEYVVIGKTSEYLTSKTFSENK